MYATLRHSHSGKKPRRTQDLPKATKLLEAREELNLDKNQGKTIIVAGRRPGFSCQMCRRTFQDSASYLGHVNGRYREFCGTILDSDLKSITTILTALQLDVLHRC